MLPKILGFAASASAFLIVPEFNRPDKALANDEIKALPVFDVAAVPPSALHQKVSLPCAQCPGEDATLEFDLEVRNHEKLLFNGFEVFPDTDLDATKLKAVVSSSDVMEAEAKQISYMLMKQVVDVDNQGMLLVDITLTVGAVGSVNVNEPEFVASVLVTPEWQLYLADVKVSEPREPEPEPVCEDMWCRVKQLWNKLGKGGMGCHRHHKPGNPEPPTEYMESTPVSDEQGDEHRPHEHSGHRGGHHGHHGHHHYGKMVKKLTSHILLPVVMGITAGVGVAVLAMLACSIVVRLTSLLSGRAYRDPWAMPAEVVIIEEEGDEKCGLMADQAPPPEYEQPTEKS